MPTKAGRYKMSMYLGTGGAAFITVCEWFWFCLLLTLSSQVPG